MEREGNYPNRSKPSSACSCLSGARSVKYSRARSPSPDSLELWVSHGIPEGQIVCSSADGYQKVLWISRGAYCLTSSIKAHSDKASATFSCCSGLNPAYMGRERPCFATSSATGKSPLRQPHDS